MDSDAETPWHMRLAREMNANREELREFLSRAGIFPIDAEEFIASAILSVTPERWSTSTKLFALLKQAMREWLRSHREERTKTKRKGSG